MFLRSNARSAGLTDRGQPMQATYVAALESGALRCRHPAATELERLVDWRVRFAVEALGATDGPDLRQASADDVRLQHERGTDWLLLAGATPVSYSVFNAMLADIVQIGGVWAPPERRGGGPPPPRGGRAPPPAPRPGGAPPPASPPRPARRRPRRAPLF